MQNHPITETNKTNLQMTERSYGGVQHEMDNLLKSIGADPTSTEYDVEDEDEEEDESPDYRRGSGGGDDSYALGDRPPPPTGKHPDMSIFGAEGQLLYQDIVDGDLVEHDDVLQTTFLSMKSAARLHMIQIKQRLIAEKESALQACERHHVRLMELKEAELVEVERKLAATEVARARMVVRYEAIKSKVPFLLDRSRAYYSSQFSIVRLFFAWRSMIVENRCNGKLERMADTLKKRATLAQTFSALNKENFRNKIAQAKEENKKNIDRVTKEIVESYESELVRLRQEAAEAHVIARHELMRRKQLEEDMRRMILKNMTAMNFEALQLFQNTTQPGPAEQQQQLGELSALMGEEEMDMMPRRVQPTPTGPGSTSRTGPLVDTTNGGKSSTGGGSIAGGGAVKSFPSVGSGSAGDPPQKGKKTPAVTASLR